MLRWAIAGGSILGAAVIGGLVWFGSDCDGTVVRTSWQCVRNAGFEPDFCKNVFQSEEDAIGRAPAVYPTEMACKSAFPNCVESKRPAGWSPRPRSYCVVTGADGRPVTYAPVL